MAKVKKRYKGDNFILKFWDFLWNGDSFLSWVTFLVVIFIFIKFIFFPSLSVIFGTQLPIVIVESCSMYHDYKLDAWWTNNGGWYESNGINKNDFIKFPIKNGFTKGDIFLVTGVKKDNIKVGDIIIFSNTNSQKPVIHRVVGLNPIETKGDNNSGQIPFEANINNNNIIGKATNVKIPLIGWLKLIFFEPFRSEKDRGFCVG